jgi:hypothetical protein
MNSTRINGMDVPSHSFKFDFSLEDWQWLSASTDLHVGMELSVTGASIKAPPMVVDPKGTNSYDFGNFAFQTPDTFKRGGVDTPLRGITASQETIAYCGGVIVPVGSPCGTGPAASAADGLVDSSPAPSEFIKEIFLIDYHFPNFDGDKMVYDPIISVKLPADNSGSTGGTSGTGTTGGSNSGGVIAGLLGNVSDGSGTIVLAVLLVFALAALAAMGSLFNRRSNNASSRGRTTSRSRGRSSEQEMRKMYGGRSGPSSSEVAMNKMYGYTNRI